MVVVVEHYNEHIAPANYDDHMTMAMDCIHSHKMVVIHFLHNDIVKKESIIHVDKMQVVKNSSWLMNIQLDCRSHLMYHHTMDDGMMNGNFLYYVDDVDAGCGGEKNYDSNWIKNL